MIEVVDNLHAAAAQACEQCVAVHTWCNEQSHTANANHLIEAQALSATSSDALETHEMLGRNSLDRLAFSVGMLMSSTNGGNH